MQVEAVTLSEAEALMDAKIISCYGRNFGSAYLKNEDLDQPFEQSKLQLAQLGAQNTEKWYKCEPDTWRKIESDAQRMINEKTKNFRTAAYLPSKYEVLKAFEDVLHATGIPLAHELWDLYCMQGDLVGAGRLNDIWPTYEFVTVEMVAALGDYIAGKAQISGNTAQNPFVVLEVGAGMGQLSYFVQKYLNDKYPGLVRVIPTDSGTILTDKHLAPGPFPVETKDYQEALSVHSPKMVICSWMPYGEDWTPYFRRNPNVQEYLLLGPADEWIEYSPEDQKQWEEAGRLVLSVCGKLETFGLGEDGPVAVPAYSQDGFDMRVLPQISRHQLNRMDFRVLNSDQARRSVTLSFTRR